MAMKLITEVELPVIEHKLLPQHRLFFCGSCFSGNIGEKLLNFGFQTVINPLGVLFNPASIRACFQYLHDEREFQPDDFFEDKGIYYSFLLHSKHSGTNLNNLINYVNTELKQKKDFLKQTNFVFITLGTSFVFELKENNQIVANCHKQNPELFNRRMLSVDEVQQEILKTIAIVRSMNPDASIVFTISPIRHWRDGALENQVSKSHLFSALYPLLSTQNLYYFPSYELMMDELRDYRFYADDLIHLSEMAIEYIWEKFQQVFFSPLSADFVNELNKIIRFAAHRPFNPEATVYHKAVANMLENLNRIEQKYGVDLWPIAQKLRTLLHQ